MNLAFVGVGGYGMIYVRWYLKQTDPEIHLVGIVEKDISRCIFAAEIAERGIPVYETQEELYRTHNVDLTVIAAPTFLHADHSICALAHGSAVLCEKPAAPTMADVERMIRAEQEYGKFIAIGYQWSYSDPIRQLKQDILSGVLGKPRSMKTLILWPRETTYYARGGGWGGRISKDGYMILDSIASNACAHYIHNMLFLLGGEMQSSAEILHTEAVCLRANAIENFDTCILRLTAGADVPLYFAASHAVDRVYDPVFTYEFDNASVTFDSNGDSIVRAQFNDGTVREYGSLQISGEKKLYDCMDALRMGIRPVCTCETAAPHVRLIESLHHNVPIWDFPPELLRKKENLVYVDGLYDRMLEAYEQKKLLSEL